MIAILGERFGKMTQTTMKTTREIALLLRDNATNNIIGYDVVERISRKKSVSPTIVVDCALNLSLNIANLPAGMEQARSAARSREGGSSVLSKLTLTPLILKQIMTGGIYRELPGGEDGEGFVFARITAFRKERQAIVDLMAEREIHEKQFQSRIAELQAQLSAANRKIESMSCEDGSHRIPSDQEISRRGAESFFNIL
ncbi:hypothetical protein ACEUZ9_001130 [Paracoccus litorisediminis]|uniref:hypothetical protein n=1 Tax=Paracoccus litorisediminis TaxID=2006130 RepID=UPI003730B176